MTLFSPRFDPFKVSLYFGYLLLCLAFAKFIDKPYMGIAAGFCVIASTFVTCERMTQRNDVSRDSARAGGRRYWYPMVHCYSMPKARWSTADRTTVVKVIEAFQPIVFGQSVRQIKLTSAAVLSHLGILSHFWSFVQGKSYTVIPTLGGGYRHQ